MKKFKTVAEYKAIALELNEEFDATKAKFDAEPLNVFHLIKLKRIISKMEKFQKEVQAAIDSEKIE